MDDDLNTAEALAAVFEYVRDANSAMDAGEFRAGNRGRARCEFLERFDSVFDVLRRGRGGRTAISDAEVEALVAERTPPRKRAISRAPTRSAQQLAGAGHHSGRHEGRDRWKRK